MKDDDALYSFIAEEITAGRIDRLTWIRACDEAKGNSQDAQVRYVALRAKALREIIRRERVAKSNASWGDILKTVLTYAMLITACWIAIYFLSVDGKKLQPVLRPYKPSPSLSTPSRISLGNAERFLDDPATPPPSPQIRRATPVLPVRLFVNSELLSHTRKSVSGSGKLSVVNGTMHNALVKLVDVSTGKKILSLAVAAYSTASINTIADGTYEVVFAFGDSLYIRYEKFRVPEGSSKFDEYITFETTADERNIIYSTWSLTLNAVADGNAKTSEVDESYFDNLQ